MKRQRQGVVAVIIIVILILMAPRFPWGVFVSRAILRSDTALRSAFFHSTQDQAFVERLTAEVARLSAVEAENEQLRQQLNFFQRQNFNRFTTYVLSKDPFNSNFLTLSAGTNNGIEVGQPVIVGEGILIGKIIGVETERSLVELLTSDVSKVPAMTTDESQTSGLLQGKLGTSLILQYVPSSVQLKEGEIVVTSGLEQQVPRGLVIGSIASIEQSNSEIFSSAVVKPAVDYMSQYLVSVIIENK